MTTGWHLRLAPPRTDRRILFTVAAAVAATLIVAGFWIVGADIDALENQRHTTAELIEQQSGEIARLEASNEELTADIETTRATIDDQDALFTSTEGMLP